MSDITNKYADATAEELMTAWANCTDDKEKLEISRLMRSAMRQAETSIRDTLKKENEESRQEKKALQETHNNFIATRKEYLNSWKTMNKIANTKSMLKNYEDFNAAAMHYRECSKTFMTALGAHLKSLKTVKEQKEND